MTDPLTRLAIPRILVRRERWPGGYEVKGVPLVYPGQEVLPDQPVLRLLPVAQVDTGQGEAVPAGLRGRVVGISRRGGVVIESPAILVSGVLGAGKQVVGALALWQARKTNRLSIPPGAILVVPGPVNLALLHQALGSGVAGIVASSAPLRDLEGFLRTELIQLLNCNNIEQAVASLPPLTLLLTEGIGMHAMSRQTQELLGHYQGSIALLSGATSVRQSISPELVISVSLEEAQRHGSAVKPDLALVAGVLVEVCDGEHRGIIGVVDYLFASQQIFASGLRERAVRLSLENGSTIVVPILHVKRLG